MNLLQCILFLKVLSSLSDFDYEYEDVTIEKNNSDGARLVGAAATSFETVPFIVAINSFFDNEQRTSCTGSLITPTFVLTAAHCTEYIPQREGNVESRNKACVRDSTNGGVYEVEPGREIKCRYIMFRDLESNVTLKNLEITLVKPKGRVWVGVDDLRNRNFRHQTSTIKRVFRHAHSYRGGGTYGDYGGYDIALLELDDEINAKLACLPGPSFNDQDTYGSLAGYGKYLRDYGRTCETNQYGMSKHHYCKKSRCKSDKPPPQNKLCEKFFREIGNWSENGKYTEALIIDNGESISCHNDFNPENENYGWCWTKGNYYHHERSDPHEWSWGYCSKDCFLDTEAGDGQVLRHIEKAHVLDDAHCQKFLETSLYLDTVKYKPEILCVGDIFKWKVALYERKNGFRKIPEDEGEKFLRTNHYGMRLNPEGYVASAGTCAGDSGGPLYTHELDFKQHKRRYIVTGIVSGGRGDLAKCGGINNPVHYVRVRKFLYWIIRLLKRQTQLICWDSKFSEKMTARQRGKKRI